MDWSIGCKLPPLFREGGGGVREFNLLAYWLRTTPSLVTENIGLEVSVSVHV